MYELFQATVAVLSNPELTAKVIECTLRLVLSPELHSRCGAWLLARRQSHQSTPKKPTRRNSRRRKKSVSDGGRDHAGKRVPRGPGVTALPAAPPGLHRVERYVFKVIKRAK